MQRVTSILRNAQHRQVAPPPLMIRLPVRWRRRRATKSSTRTEPQGQGLRGVGRNTGGLADDDLEEHTLQLAIEEVWEESRRKWR